MGIHDTVLPWNIGLNPNVSKNAKVGAVPNAPAPAASLASGYKPQSVSGNPGVDLSKNSWTFKPTTPVFDTPLLGGLSSGTIPGVGTLGTSKNPSNLSASDLKAISQGIPINGTQEDMAAKLHAMDSMGIYGGAGAGSAAAGAKGGLTGAVAPAIPPAVTNAALAAGAGFVVSKGLEAGYNAVTGNGGGNTSTGNPALDAMLKQRSEIDAENQKGIQAAIARMNAMANPYDPNSDTFKNALKGKQDRLTQAFNGAERAYMSKVARGGLMGGYNAAGMGNLIGARSRGYADVTSDMYDTALRGNADFEMNRQRSILAALSGNNQNSAEMAYNVLLNNQARTDGMWRDAGSLAGAMGKWGAENPEKVQALWEMITGGK